MSKFYLYIKTSPLGLKYLGYTANNPYSYLGSGKRWRSHINKHNFTEKDIHTEIVFETTDKKELTKMGIYYSDLYDVVKSDNWANLKKEEGDGGAYFPTEEQRKKLSTIRKGNHNFFGGKEVFIVWLKGKKMTPEWCKKMGEWIKKSRQTKFECKYCHIKVDASNLSKSHNERCKSNPNYINTDKACKYCGKTMDAANLGRYHNEKCKLKPIL